MTSLKVFSITATFALLVCSACRSKQQRENDSVLVSVGEALDEIRGKSPDMIPDSVFNAAKCIITVPFLPPPGDAGDAVGIASCRTVDWQEPMKVTFAAHSGQQEHSSLIVVLLSDKAAAALRSGKLALERQRRKPPLVSTKALVTDFDLTSDYMAYEAPERKTLTASLATGYLRELAPLVDSGAWANNAQHLRESLTAVGKYQSSLESFVNTIVPTGIVVHHTAVVASNKVPRGEKEVDQYHQERGLQIYCDQRVFHVAYHYLISPEGKVERGRPDRCEGAHARGYNSYLGISLIGDFSTKDNPSGAKGPEKPTAEQMKALVKLCRLLRQKYDIPLQHVLRHSDISSTDCPGDRFPFNEFLRSLGKP